MGFDAVCPPPRLLSETPAQHQAHAHLARAQPQDIRNFARVGASPVIARKRCCSFEIAGGGELELVFSTRSREQSKNVWFVFFTSDFTVSPEAASRTQH